MAVHLMPAPTSPDTGVNVGLLFASAMVPGTFARSLSARTPMDQGIATGLSVGLHYLLAVATQDTIQAVAAELVGARGRTGGSRTRRCGSGRSRWPLTWPPSRWVWRCSGAVSRAPSGGDGAGCAAPGRVAARGDRGRRARC